MPKSRSSAVINVLVAGDTKKFRKSMRKAGASIADFAKAGAQASIVAAAAIAGLGKKAVDLAVDFEEGLSKAKAIFGDAAGFIEAGAKSAATEVGLSKSEFLDAASSFGVFGKAAGLSGRELTSFSQDLVTVAADVASFNNLRPEEALEKLQAGLRGSNEPLQSIGVLINAAQVEAKALEMGLVDSNGELSEQNKILARTELIYEQLGKQGALGDFAATSSGLANQTRILKARFKNLGIELGRKLIPIAMKVVKVIDKLITFGRRVGEMYNKSGFTGVVRSAVAAMKKLWPIVQKQIINLTKKAAKQLKKFAKLFVEWIKPLIMPMLRKLGEWAKAIGSFILEKLPMIGEKIGVLAAAFLDWVGPMIKKLLVKMPDIIKAITVFIATKVIPKVVEAAGKLGEKLVPALLNFTLDILEGLGSIGKEVAGAFKDKVIDPVVDQAKQLAGKISNALINFANDAGSGAKTLGKKIIDSFIDGLQSVGGFFADLGNSLADAFMASIKAVWNNVVADPLNAGIEFGVDVLDKLLGPTINFPATGEVIPRLAEGGLVKSPTLALIGEAGPEMVVPLDKAQGMGTTTINITMPAGSSGEDVVAALENYVRRNGSIPLAVNNLVRQ